jgi:hypothetical protein
MMNVDLTIITSSTEAYQRSDPFVMARPSTFSRFLGAQNAFCVHSNKSNKSFTRVRLVLESVSHDKLRIRI